jgi:hypothetical protein
MYFRHIEIKSVGRGKILEERALCWRRRKSERARKKKEDL